MPGSVGMEHIRWCFCVLRFDRFVFLAPKIYQFQTIKFIFILCCINNSWQQVIRKPVNFPLKWCHMCKEHAFVAWTVKLSIWVPQMKKMPNLLCQTVYSAISIDTRLRFWYPLLQRITTTNLYHVWPIVFLFCLV